MSGSKLNPNASSWKPPSRDTPSVPSSIVATAVPPISTAVPPISTVHLPVPATSPRGSAVVSVPKSNIIKPVFRKLN